jgi:hypothetical protein
VRLSVYALIYLSIVGSNAYHGPAFDGQKSEKTSLAARQCDYGLRPSIAIAQRGVYFGLPRFCDENNISGTVNC